MTTVQQGLRVTILALGINITLALGKIVTGVLGHSNALVADGIESVADVFSSFVVWGGLRVASRPADEKHPFGHGRAETVASILVSLIILSAATVIAVHSGRQIRSPHPEPLAWFTLVVLVGVVLIKEWLFRRVSGIGQSLESTALRADAWHHRSDALTSAAALVGILIALVGGKAYQNADDWAALAACGVIAWNGLRLLYKSLDEIMDASVPQSTVMAIRTLAGNVPEVRAVEKCRVRKVGLYLSLDIHVVVGGDLTVRHGHEIAHQVKDVLMASAYRINDVVVHTEPDMARPDHGGNVQPP